MSLVTEGKTCVVLYGRMYVRMVELEKKKRKRKKRKKKKKKNPKQMKSAVRRMYVRMYVWKVGCNGKDSVWGYVCGKLACTGGTGGEGCTVTRMRDAESKPVRK